MDALRSLDDRVKAVVEVAATHADTVDAGARFPSEAMATVRKERLLSIAIPKARGGEGLPLSDVSNVCYGLGRACSATAMIYAMHQIKIACLVGHAGENAWLLDFQNRIADKQLLLASSTTEGQGGGDVRNSAGALEPDGDGFRLTRSATVMSYGAEADGLLSTARRSPDAASNDQVLVALEEANYTLEPLKGWETLGMRGTSSAGFNLNARIDAAQVFPVPYNVIHARAMMPVAHLVWSSAWAGIAASALDRARKFIRMAASKSQGALPPGAAHLTQGNLTLRSLRHNIQGALATYEAARANGDALDQLDVQTELTLLKVNASELAIATVMSALRATGLTGYRNDGDFSVGRHLRDILSSSIMINNDRILANSAGGLLLSQTPDKIHRIS
jgi:acyl-CoA dehydrogenase